jgi:hypothetical protein
MKKKRYKQKPIFWLLEMKTGFKKKTEQNRKTGLPPKPTS